MELKGSKTENNLMAAFAGESMAYTKYGYFASRAKKDGYVQMSEIFAETAANEKEHAKIWFKLLYDGMPDTAGCLALAAQSENEEWSEMYPRMAAEAREEGFGQIAALFEKVGAIEQEHEARYQALAENLKQQQVFARQEQQVWQCINCGYTYIGTSAPLVCPVCAHPQSYFEIKATNYR
jgi:rubrerythrin